MPTCAMAVSVYVTHVFMIHSAASVYGKTSKGYGHRPHYKGHFQGPK